MNSIAFKKFKAEIGQANHFLITILVGLDAVEDGATKRQEFKTSWEPKDIKSSVHRSRQYAIKSALAWVVDNLDMYLRLCNKNPKLYQEKESEEISSTKHSVYQKYKCIVKNHSQISLNTKAFVDLLICWRNNMVHYDADNELLIETKKYFHDFSNGDVTISKYNLDIQKMLDRFEQNLYPSFKETTTMISMTIKFVEEIDSILLNEIQQNIYLDQMLKGLYKKNKKISTVFSFNNTTADKRIKKIKQLFRTQGIEEDFYNKEGIEYIEKLSQMSFKDFLNYTP